MRINLFLIIGVFALLSCRLFGEKVDETIARKAALNWYRHYAPDAKKNAVIARETPYKFNSRECFRIFSFDRGGFVLVSSSDAVNPILGYGFDGIAPDSIASPALKAWLDQYARKIDTAILIDLHQEGAETKWEDILANRYQILTGDSIGPLLTTTWDQGWPYNAMCPELPSGPGGHALAGCVAIAMAQVLKYHNWPPTGHDSMNYSYNGVINWPYGLIGANFGNTAYQWQNMPDAISEPNMDLARLVFHAGISVKSMYGYPSGQTGAYAGSIIDGLVRCFNYAYSDLTFQMRYYGYSSIAWDSLIRSELLSQRPVIYSGSGINNSGHAFVCDGVNALDYFHFNFGWGGSYNGYYMLLDISPGSYNFNFLDGVIIGIKPNDGSTILDDQTWSGVVNLNRKTILLDHSTLTLLPGTTVISSFGSSLQISGILNANGVAGDSIRFTAADPQLRWDGLTVEQGNWDETDSTTMDYSVIELSRYGGLKLNNLKKFQMNHSSVRNNKEYPYIAYDGSYWCSAYNCCASSCSGGGIFAAASDGRIINSRISGNWAWGSGGGISVYGPNNMLYVDNCLIDHNETRLNGGGCYLNAGAKVRIRGNEFKANSATEGGAIALYNISVDSLSEAPLIFGNHIWNNGGAFSAGIFSGNSDAMIVNNVISENSCFGMGDNVLSISGSGANTKVWLVNNTIVCNSGSNAHIGISGDVSFSPRFYNTIIADNSSLGCIGGGALVRIETSGIKPVFHHCYISKDSLSFSGSPGASYFSDTAFFKNNLSYIDPRLSSVGDWKPNFNSPCIDEGNSIDFLAWLNPTDIAGNPRMNRKIDIGAWEDISDTLYPCVVSCSSPVYRCLGDSVENTIRYHGENLRFQWLLNHVVLPGDTTATLHRTAVSMADSGQYTCRVWNGAGRDSTFFLLCVCPQAPAGVGTIAGPSLLHHFECSAATAAPVTGATSYVWESSPGIRITSFCDTNRTVHFDVLESAGTEYIRVKAYNPCGLSPEWQIKLIQCDPVPATLGDYIYINRFFCAGTFQMFTYDLGNCYDQYLDLQWELPPGCHVQWFTNRVIGFQSTAAAQSGMIRVRWIRAGYGQGDWREDFLDIQPQLTGSPGPVIGPDTVFMHQDSIRFHVLSVPGATGYNWEIPAGMTIMSGINDSLIILRTQGEPVSGVIRVRAYNVCGSSDYSALKEIRGFGVEANQAVDHTVFPNESDCFDAGLVLSLAGQNASFIVDAGGNATLIAGQKILFLSGTVAVSGSVLHGYISPQGPWCAMFKESTAGSETEMLLDDDGQPGFEESGFRVYPNPTTCSFTVDIESGTVVTPATIQCYDLMGDLIMEKTIHSGTKYELTLEGRKPGIYLLRLIRGSDSSMQKIIKR